MSIGKKATIFLVSTFAVSWTALVLSWLHGQREVTTGGGVAFGIYVFSPALAAIACSLAFEKGERLKALGIRFRPNWWWLWAVVIPIGLTALAIGVTALFSPYKLVGIDGAARQFANLQHQEYSDLRSYLIRIAGLIVLAAVQNIIIATITEELGWRGYLYHLWRPFGFWRASFAIGLVWGVWHWPMIYLFGLNYPDHRALGLAIFPALTMLMAPFETLVRDHGRSVGASGILHGTFNTVLVFTVLTLDDPKFPWSGAGIGIIAALAIGTLVLALVQRSTRRIPRPGEASVVA